MAGGMRDRLGHWMVGRLSGERVVESAAPPQDAASCRVLARRGRSDACCLIVERMQCEETSARLCRCMEVAEVALCVALLDDLDAVVQCRGVRRICSPREARQPLLSAKCGGPMQHGNF